jgi:hypothetical protein
MSQPLSPSWLRLALPSLPDVIFIALLFSFAVGPLSQKLLSDGDIGWHIRNGQLIVNLRVLPRTDVFSSTMNGQPWFAWEWLYDAIIGAVYNTTGLNGVVTISVWIIATSFLIAVRMMLRGGGNYIIILVLFLLAVSAAMIHALARPHLVSWLFVVVWFAILDREETEPGNTRLRTRLYWLPVLMLAWVNLHGGFLLGFVLLGIYAIAALLSAASRDAVARSIATRRVKLLAEISVLSALASLVNPYGYSLHLHIYRYLSNRFLMTHISEFKSPNFHGVAERCFVLLLAISSLAVAVSWRRCQRSHILLLLFSGYTGLHASRNIPISSLLLAMITAPLLSLHLQRFAEAQSGSVLRAFASRLHAFSKKTNLTQNQLKGHLWPALALIVIAWACLHNGSIGSSHLLNAHFDPRHFPVQAVDRFADEKVTEPVFTQDSWGGYLIYRLFPQTKVVVDDRHDLYGEYFLREYLKVLHVEPGWQSVLDNWKVNLVVMPRNSPLTAALYSDPLWRAVESDDVATTFQRISTQPW